jgi:hypothetical protein
MARRFGNRAPESYRRSGPSREPYEYLAIVCEGEKTEPYYFQELRADHSLSSANIHITPAPGTDPPSVVTYGERLLVERSYDKVYGVFDRDQHDTYGAAIQQIDALTRRARRPHDRYPFLAVFRILAVAALRLYNHATGSTNPATLVHFLVEHLTNLRST